MARLRPAAAPDRDRVASWTWEIRLRLAGPADAGALRALGELDARPVDGGPHLLAERDGTIAAAISLRSGDVLADPFLRTAELCALLRCHAGPVRLPGAGSGRRGRADRGAALVGENGLRTRRGQVMPAVESSFGGDRPT